MVWLTENWLLLVDYITVLIQNILIFSELNLFLLSSVVYLQDFTIRQIQVQIHEVFLALSIFFSIIEVSYVKTLTSKARGLINRQLLHWATCFQQAASLFRW